MSRNRTRIKDIFNEDAFCISKIVQECNSSQREFLVKVNGHPYLISYKEMERLCRTYGISIEAEVSDTCYPFQKYDNRSVGRKYLDACAQNRINLNYPSLRFQSISADRVVSLVGNRAAVFAEKVED